MNLLSVRPYLLRDTWVFDDARVGLKEEAFVAGMTEIISAVVEHKGIPDAARGFVLQFGDGPFDGFDACLEWDSAVPPGDASGYGNWYKTAIGGREMKGWLCPALGLYFDTAPERLYVRAEPLPEGADPIWRAGSDRGKRFVTAPGAD